MKYLIGLVVGFLVTAGVAKATIGHNIEWNGLFYNTPTIGKYDLNSFVASDGSRCYIVTTGSPYQSGMWAVAMDCVGASR